MNPKPYLHSLFTGMPKTIVDEKGTWTSSIYRDRTPGPTDLGLEGLSGDQVTQPYHGGVDGAVCVHLLDHYRYWQEQIGLSLPPGSVGENFTLEHITESEVCAGDVVRVGTALVQVTGPRIPCANLARRIGRPDWVKLTLRHNRTGFYLRVLETGMVKEGDAWELVERFNPAGSMPAINGCIFLEFDPAYAEKMQHMQGLSDYWKGLALERAEKQSDHWAAKLKDQVSE